MSCVQTVPFSITKAANQSSVSHHMLHIPAVHKYNNSSKAQVCRDEVLLLHKAAYKKYTSCSFTVLAALADGLRVYLGARLLFVGHVID